MDKKKLLRFCELVNLFSYTKDEFISFKLNTVLTEKNLHQALKDNLITTQEYLKLSCEKKVNMLDKYDEFYSLKKEFLNFVNGIYEKVEAKPTDKNLNQTQNQGQNVKDSNKITTQKTNIPKELENELINFLNFVNSLENKQIKTTKKSKKKVRK